MALEGFFFFLYFMILSQLVGLFYNPIMLFEMKFSYSSQIHKPGKLWKQERTDKGKPPSQEMVVGSIPRSRE